MTLISSASYQFFYISFLAKMVIQLSSYKAISSSPEATAKHQTTMVLGWLLVANLHVLFTVCSERERERGHLAFKDADNPNAGSICHGTNWTHVSAVPKSDHWPASPSCFHLAALHFLYGFWVLTGAKWISALLEVSITCDEPMIFFLSDEPMTW